MAIGFFVPSSRSTHPGSRNKNKKKPQQNIFGTGLLRVLAMTDNRQHILNSDSHTKIVLRSGYPGALITRRSW